MSQQQGWGQPPPPGWRQPPSVGQPPGWNQPPGTGQQQGWGQPPGTGQQPGAGQQPWGQPRAGQWPGWDVTSPGDPWSGPPPPPPQWGPPPTGGPAGPTKYCPSCGSVIDARAIDCPRCGVRQPDAIYREPKSRPIAILLALLLGAFGVHRFYVGPVLWGIAYLVFFWTGIPAFLAWLEALYWLTRSDVEWAQTYGGPVQQANGCAIGCLWILALLPILVIVLAIAAIPGLLFLGGGAGLILSEISSEILSGL